MSALDKSGFKRPGAPRVVPWPHVPVPMAYKWVTGPNKTNVLALIEAQCFCGCGQRLSITDDQPSPRPSITEDGQEGPEE